VSLSDKLSQPPLADLPRLCKLAQILESDQLSSDDKSKLIEVLNVPIGTPGRLSNSDITRALHSEAIDISLSVIDRHRGKFCRCYAPSKTK
jgi:hypothetical protein